VLTIVAADNSEFYGRYSEAPTSCSNASWQEILSFFLVLSLATAFVEGLNWVGFCRTRHPRSHIKIHSIRTRDDIVYDSELPYDRFEIQLRA
jgi:hypothetical protein